MFCCCYFILSIRFCGIFAKNSKKINPDTPSLYFLFSTFPVPKIPTDWIQFMLVIHFKVLCLQWKNSKPQLKKKLKKVHGLNEPISGRWTRQSPLKQFHFRTFQLIQELPKIASIVAENAGLRKRFCCENCGVSDSIDGKHSERNSRFDERRRTVRASRTHWQKMGVNQNHSSFVCAW